MVSRRGFSYWEDSLSSLGSAVNDGYKRESETALEDDERMDNVNHPNYYGGKENPYEVIKVLQAWMDPVELRGFCKANALKYLARAGKKPGQLEKQDLQKAKWYLEYLITTLTTETEK